jgi:chromosome segregation ATPase
MSDLIKINNSDEQRKLVFLECETMQSEGVSEISSRTVAARPGISKGKSTISKFVTEWHTLKDAKLMEVLEQTRMSPHFVTALNTEIDNRMSEQATVLKATIERQNTELRNLTEDLTSTEQQLMNAQVETSELKTKTTEIQTEHKNLNNKYNETVELLNNKYNEETARLNKSIIETNGKVESLHSRLNTKTEELGKQRNIAETKETENNNLNKEMNELNKVSRKQNDEITHHKQESSGLKQKVIGQENELKSKDEIIKLHLAQIKDANQSLSGMQTKIDTMGSNATSTASELATANINVSTLTIQLLNAEQNKTKLEQEIVKSEAKLEQERSKNIVKLQKDKK